MDNSGKSLLDLLNKPTSNGNSGDAHKEQLLSLFGPQPVKSPEVSAYTSGPASPSSEKPSNATDLLAALMGSSATAGAQRKASSSEQSANLLSVLMGASEPKTTEVESKPDVKAKQPTVVDVPDSSVESAAQTPSKSQNLPSFVAYNVFDELEALTKQIKSTKSPSVATPDPVSSSPAARIQPKTLPKASPAKSTPSKPKQPANSKKASPPPPTVTPLTAAYRLQQEASSMCKLPVSLPRKPLQIKPTPLSKLSVKHEPLNRNIIAASNKYFAYPVSKEGSVGSVRLVDQDSGASILVEHSATIKVISLAFAKNVDNDGSNALLTVDAENNIMIWSVKSSCQLTKLFEIAGPSDGSHKSKAQWNATGTQFAVAITSRIFVFDYIAISTAQKSTRIKLNPEAKHCLGVCKTEKAIKAFAFSPDGTAIAGVDKASNLRLWTTPSGGTTENATSTITLGERALFSIEFVSSRHVVVGSQSNESIVLVDLQAAKNAQEIKLPVADQKSSYSMHSKLQCNDSLLMVSNEARQGILMFKLDVSDADTETGKLISALTTDNTHLEATGAFTHMLELSFKPEDVSKLLCFAASTNGSSLDVFIAHDRGFALFPMPRNEINASWDNASPIEGATISRLPHLGHLVPAPGSELPSTPAKQTPRPASPEDEIYSRHKKPTAPKAVSVKEDNSQSMEAKLRQVLTSELQRTESVQRTHIDNLQKSNDARHETILRLVSETLSNNTAGVLKNTVSTVMNQDVLPKLIKHLDESLPSQLESSIPKILLSLTKELGQAIESAIKASPSILELQSTAKALLAESTARASQTEQTIAGALLRLDAQIGERQAVDAAKISQLQLSIDALQSQVQALLRTRAEPAPAVPRSIPGLPVSLPYSSLALHQHPPTVPRPQTGDDAKKYLELIMEFVSKTQKLQTGDNEGSAFVVQFLSWQPAEQMKDSIAQALADDQLQLVAFVHALASELSENDAYNRIHWIASTVPYLSVEKDPRLAVLGPRLMQIVKDNLLDSLNKAPPSAYRQLLELTLNQFTSRMR